MTVALLTPPTDEFPVSIEARVRFGQQISTAGFVDGAWWPRSSDLTRELPGLLDVLWTAGREVTHVSYQLAAWDKAPRRMRVEGRLVRLGGFQVADPLLLVLTDSRADKRVDLVVIPPDTEPDVAKQALSLATRSAGMLRPAEMLAQAQATHLNR